MKTRWAALLLSGALVVVVALAIATFTRGASDATPTPVPPTATAAPPATATLVPTTAPAATATATSVPAATATPLPVATPAQPATATATLAPSPTATKAPPAATATITSPLPTPTQATSPLSPPATVAAPAVTPVILTSSASLAINGQVIAYSYPSGWSLKQETKDRYTVVTLEGPEGALLTLTTYGVDMSPDHLSASLLEALKKQFNGATATSLKDTVGGLPAEGYTVKFTHMGLPMTGTILSLRGGKSTVTLYTQAADADLSVLQARFDVVKNTLVVK